MDIWTDEGTYGWTNGHRDRLTDTGTDKIQYGDASTHLIRPRLERINNFQYFYSIKELLTAVKKTIKKTEEFGKEVKRGRSHMFAWGEKKKRRNGEKKRKKKRKVEEVDDIFEKKGVHVWR